jgi:hypothetical protein
MPAPDLADVVRPEVAGVARCDLVTVGDAETERDLQNRFEGIGCRNSVRWARGILLADFLVISVDLAAA